MAGGLTLVDQRTNRQFDSFPYQGILLPPEGPGDGARWVG